MGDYINDDNVEILTKKYQQNKNQNNDNDQMMKNDQNENENNDEKEYAQEAKEKYEKIMTTHQNDKGIGSVLWLLCKLLIDSTPKDEESDNEKDKIAKITHIGKSQLLLIERI